MYRIFTAMFFHESIWHIGLNMLSLFFIGPFVEQVFGRWRYASIYFIAGILAGVAQIFTLGTTGYALGASGAIFGVFGALGAFLFLRRRALGPAVNGLIGQWVFFLVINIAFSFTPGIGLLDHAGGLVSGLILGALLIPRLTPRRRMVV